MKKIIHSIGSQLALAALLLFVACSKKDYIHKYTVTPVSNEGFPPLSEQFEMNNPYIVGDTLYWTVLKEYDISHYSIKKGALEIGRVESVGFGVDHFYKFKLTQ